MTIGIVTVLEKCAFKTAFHPHQQATTYRLVSCGSGLACVERGACEELLQQQHGGTGGGRSAIIPMGALGNSKQVNTRF